MKGMLLCYRTLDELTSVYKNILEGMKKKPWKHLVSYLTLLNENDVPYPYTLVVLAENCFDAFDNFIVDEHIDIGHPDMYMLSGREHDIVEMMPIEVKIEGAKNEQVNNEGRNN